MTGTLRNDIHCAGHVCRSLGLARDQGQVQDGRLFEGDGSGDHDQVWLIDGNARTVAVAIHIGVGARIVGELSVVCAEYREENAAPLVVHTNG